MRTWTTIDKSDWIEKGAWSNEPDKAQWIDENTGLDCLIVRSICTGALCGYVGVPRYHPLYMKKYSEIETDFDVHGGLTFSGKCCPEAIPEKGICHTGQVSNNDVWWLGFDCAHCDDIAPAFGSLNKSQYFENIYRTFDYVKNEVEDLAIQIKEFKDQSQAVLHSAL